jgi:hypothetical protein
MSRINRTDPITGILKTLSSTKTDNVDKHSVKIALDSVEQLKTDVLKAIRKLESKNASHHLLARKIIINKIIQWKFGSLGNNAAKMSYLVNMVNKTIEADHKANEDLEQFIKTILN